MQTLRSFIALELTSEIQNQLHLIQEELSLSDADVKWVSPENIHLTLKFLGNVSINLLEEIKKTLHALANEHSSFKVSLGDIGAFPTCEHPRVIWVGIKKGETHSIALQKALEAKLIHFGFLPEKRDFRPHLTIGRLRSAENRSNLTKIMGSLKVQSLSTQAQNLTLFKSTLTLKGALYEPLKTLHLS